MPRERPPWLDASAEPPGWTWLPFRTTEARPLRLGSDFTTAPNTAPESGLSLTTGTMTVRVECTNGINFFITMREAEEYNG